MANLADTIVLGDLTVTREQLIKGTLTVDGLISGNGGGLTNLNASNLSSGTVSTARLPAAALVGDTTYSAGTGLSLSGTTFNINNPFNPSGAYSGLRAQATTAADVGLGSVRNVASWSQGEADGRFLAVGAKAADSNALDGIDSTGFLRSNATDTLSGRVTVSNAAGLEVPRGITGGYGDSAGSGSDWGATIWGMGDAYTGSGTGTGKVVGNYELAWLRGAHASQNSNVGEGLYVFAQNGYRGGLGTNGLHVVGAAKINGNMEANDVTITSDIRVKSDIQPVTGALQKVLSLTGFTYHMKGLAKTDRRLGLSAQDVLKVFPEAVHGTEETHYSVSYGSLVAGVIEAIKEQQSIIVDQQETIDELKDRLTALEDSRRS